MHVAEKFPRRSDQIPLARALVRTTLRGWGVDGLVEDVVLMASELFTNAITHGVGIVELRMELRPDAVRLEVVDEGAPGATMPLRPVRASVFSGRGLAIVDKLADAWGSARAGQGGTAVWVEVLRP